MVFSTPVLQKNSAIPLMNKTLIQISGLFILLLMHHAGYANSVNIKFTNTYVENNTYYLDAGYDLELSEEAYKALRHGISFEIHAQFQLRLERMWLWNKTISEKTLIYKLEHKPLTENFLTIDLNTGLRHSYDSLDAALRNIRTISKMALFDQALITSDKTYTARMRVFLDIESLPPPMRPQAYFSPSWDISSAWHEWKLAQ